MKRYPLIIGLLVFVILLILALRWFGFIPQGKPEAIPPAHVSPSTLSLTSPTPSPSSPVSNQLSPEEMQKRSEDQVRYQSHVFDLLFLTPIVFYGKVVDQNGASVEGATALISPTQGPGTDPETKETSDENGLFSITTHGLGLSVMVSKPGYYSMRESRGVFGYSVATGGEYKPHTNSRNPAIFVLRKRGETEPLIVKGLGGRISKNGTPVLVNLDGGNPNGAAEDIQVESWVHDEGIPPNAPRPYDWKCRITVPGGGLQPRTGGEFDFTAPTDGYQPSDEINMSANTRPWNDQVQKSYFLQLANGTYARIDFTIAAGGGHFFSIVSYFNPAPGHRNLEYDPAKQINK